MMAITLLPAVLLQVHCPPCTYFFLPESKWLGITLPVLKNLGFNM